MPKRLPRISLAAVVLAIALTAGFLPGQPPLPAPAQPGAAGGNGTEVLARGPVHEAYADTSAVSSAMPLVTRMPPDGIDELPPDHKPDGDNVQWIPGYWHFDEDRSDFSWISGFWRSVPPGRVWVPGSWRGAQGPQGQLAWQWAPGFWQEAPVQQAVSVQTAPQQDVQYLPQPPASVESGPTTPAPAASYFYMPGGWVWRDGRYMWRAGSWYEYRPGWVWVPAHYRWSPIGYVFVDGYWDYPLATRGVMYAPIAYTTPLYTQPGYYYTPTYVVSDQCMMGAMFVRPGWGCYYFGDYYGPQYAGVGYSAWCGTSGPNGFVVGFGVGRGWGYDPLWGYYSVAYRDSPAWRDGMGGLYVGRYNGTVAPPPITLVQQNIVITRVTNVNVVNVTENFTVVNRSITVNNVNVSGLAMVAPTAHRCRHAPGDAHCAVADGSAAARAGGGPRGPRGGGGAHAARERGRAPGRRHPASAADVHTIKHEVPRAAVAHAQAHDERRAPPANPNKSAGAAGHVNTPANHPTGQTGPAEHPGGGAKVEPKVDAKGPATAPPLPKGPNGQPGKTDPKSDPKHDSKTEPKRDPPKGNERP